MLCRSSVRALLSWEQSSFAQRRLLPKTSAGPPSRGSHAHPMPLGSAPSTFLTAQRLKPVSGAGSPILVLGADRFSAKMLVQRGSLSWAAICSKLMAFSKYSANIFIVSGARPLGLELCAVAKTTFCLSTSRSRRYHGMLRGPRGDRRPAGADAPTIKRGSPRARSRRIFRARIRGQESGRRGLGPNEWRGPCARRRNRFAEPICSIPRVGAAKKDGPANVAKDGFKGDDRWRKGAWSVAGKTSWKPRQRT